MLKLLLLIFVIFIYYSIPETSEKTKLHQAKKQEIEDKKFQEQEKIKFKVFTQNYNKYFCDELKEVNSIYNQKTGEIDKILKCVNGNGLLLKLFRDDYGNKEYRVMKIFRN